MDRRDRRQGRSSRHGGNGQTTANGLDDVEKPTHPHLQATLLMVGIVVFLVVVAALEVR